jgi:zinc protease
VVVQELELAPGVSASNRADELAGQFSILVRSYAGRPLDDVLQGIEAAFLRFETEGIGPDELRRVKAGVERQFYQSLSSVLGKAFQIAQYTIFASGPDYVNEDLERILAVTEEDLLRVYETYLKGRPHVAASFVPRGQAALALSGSTRAQVFEEPIVLGAEAPVEVADRGEITLTPSQIDRSVEPPFGRQPKLRAPRVWRDQMENGMRVLGIEDRELPLVQFSLRIDGGMLLEDPERIGVANLLGEIMTRGTANRTPEELELAIQLLGATIGVGVGREAVTLSGTTLARNWPATLALLEEILLEPRFDADEFELARRRVISQIQQRAGNPNAIADHVFASLLYGEHPLAQDPRGDLTTVGSITLSEVRRWAAENLRPDRAVLHVAGATDKVETVRGLRGLRTRWARGEAPEFPANPDPAASRAGVYFVDLPGAPQSVLRIGYLAMAETDPTYWPAQVMNFRLGGGGFASELTLTLREGLGYTYGISSGFRGGARPGPFQIGSAVRSNVTLESLQVIREILERHGPDFSDEDLEITRGFLLRSNAGAFETLGAKLGLLSSMSSLGLPRDFALRRAAAVERISVDEIRALAAQTLDTRRMAWVVVGDAETQLPRLDALGLGPVTRLDRNGRVLTPSEGPGAGR